MKDYDLISGIDVAHQLIKIIQNGYRMEKPNNAPNSFGEIMMECWKTNPKERPTFNQIVETICYELESTVRTDYLNLSAPYEQIDASYAKFTQELETSKATNLFELTNLLNENSHLNKFQYQKTENEIRYSLFPQRV